MDPRHHDILRKLQASIVKDLEVYDIIDPLISNEIVSPTLWSEIQQEPSSESKTRKLLDHLPKRGPNAYSIFKEALRSNYSWISKDMDTLENTEDCVDSRDASFWPNTPYSHIPASPPLSVERKEKMEQLRKGLTELLPGNYLALHALQGYGKSTLASATLKDKNFVNELFKNEIYWIKFGQRQSMSENILIQLNMLFHRVRNLDLLAEPTSEDSLKYSLKRHFSEHDYALIILDDVNSQEVIDAFDFGCRTLVLTAEIDILRGRVNNVIEMCDGFSANESLNLFAKATGIPVSQLPKQARQIHNECKGMPLMISMFSAHFEDIKESLVGGQTSDKTWSYYLNALREKNSDVFQESLKRQAATFDICIEKLSPEDKRCYKTLAIFPEDVNIPTQTLAIFWGIPMAEVDSIMLKFCKKSLACRKWHRCLDTYVYGVHNLVLCHLRDKFKPEDLRNLHKSYVEKNLTFCNEDFSKLPKDNYIHSYIGYHMEKGGLEDKFPGLYLDFGFIEAKVLHIGPGDLLIDLKKYRNYITKDSPKLLEEVEDLEKFLVQQASTLAEYRRRNCLDLVQVALKHPFHGFVRNSAEFLANKRQSSLYLNHLKHNVEYPNAYSEELHLQVRSVAFTNEADVILVGNDEGKVISWNCNNRQQVTFYGNNRNQPITKIVAPRKENFFVTISADGTAKLFELRGELNKQTNSSRFKTLHPRAKQPEWINMSEFKSSHDESRITLSIPGQKIIDIAVAVTEKKIAACTDAGIIAIWNFDGGLLVQPRSVVNDTLTSIAFTMCGTLLHAVNALTGSLLVLDASNGQYKTQISLHPENDKILSLLSVPQYNNLLVMLLETKLYRVTWACDGDSFRGPQTKEFARLEEKSISYNCAAVTNDGKYIVTADTGGSVNVCDLHGRFEIIRTYKNLVFSLDTYWLEKESCHIICGGNRDTLVPMVHRWKFDPEKRPVVRRLPPFDATMEPGERNVIAVATSNGKVEIFQNDDPISETPAVTGKITSLLISSNGNLVFYVTDTGSVFSFDIKLKRSTEIMELQDWVELLTILKIDEKDTIVCRKGGEDLQIWQSLENTQLVENSGAVIFCDIIQSVQRVLTVAETVLKMWDPKTWKLQSKDEIKAVPKINCCSLSRAQNYLAVANAAGNLSVLKLLPRQDLRVIKLQESMEKKFDHGITACAFSPDEELLALGLKTGEIIILDVVSNSVNRKLELHRRLVKKLYWGPPNLDEPVLVSLANELAWWNVSTRCKKETQREISHSLSELNISPISKHTESIGKMRSSKSLELASLRVSKKVSSNNKSAAEEEEVFGEKSFLACSSNSNSKTDLAQNLNGVNEAHNKSTVSCLWGAKKPKYPKIAGLLSVVKLDGDIATKICISNKFDNFVTLNDEESIYNLTILENTQNGDGANGDT